MVFHSRPGLRQAGPPPARLSRAPHAWSQVWNVMKEKEILAEFDTPFIVTSLSSFQDRAHLYLARAPARRRPCAPACPPASARRDRPAHAPNCPQILEFMAGGDLFQHLCDMKKLSLPAGRFYAAEVLLALEYIHTRQYVYRDLKPENILIADSGHAKIADMGFCKQLQPGERTYTTCGTADYMAPEVMLCQGYDKSADYWAFGVLIYEMLVGYAPFAAKSDRERHHKILTASIIFPMDFNPQSKDVVKRLCMLDVSHRLGMMAGGIEEILEHPFFAEVDWKAIRAWQARLALRAPAPPWGQQAQLPPRLSEAAADPTPVHRAAGEAALGAAHQDAGECRPTAAVRRAAALRLTNLNLNPSLNLSQAELERSAVKIPEPRSETLHPEDDALFNGY